MNNGANVPGLAGVAVAVVVLILGLFALATCTPTEQLTALGVAAIGPTS